MPAILSRPTSLAPIALLALLAWLPLAAAPSHAYTGDIPLAVDTNPDPNIFETTLVAAPALIDLGDGNPPAMMLAFNGIVPGPEIRVKVGDRVIVHVQNQLPEALTIHWHGLEINNESDGTTLTQNPMPALNGSYDYDYIAPRAGMFWYHPHVLPTDTTFRGLYGPLTVVGPEEAALVNAGVLPALRKTLVLSDTTTCGQVGVGPPDPPDIVAKCLGQPNNFVPKVQPAFDCGGVSGMCQVREGKTILSNGKVVTPSDVLPVAPGSGVRFQVLNASIMRYFRLDPPPGHMLFRIGGEGGFLDQVRLEGGNLGPLDTGYAVGEILLGPADRADFVIVPQGAQGQVLAVQSEGPVAYARGNATFQGKNNGPVLQLQVTGPADNFSIVAGDPLLTHPSVNAPLENLGLIPANQLDQLLDPALLFPPTPGSPSHTIQLQSGVNDGGSSGPGIDGVRGTFDEVEEDDFLSIPHIGSSRFALVDDTLELTVDNVSGSDHPFHLHGFSFQPRSVTDGVDTFNYDFQEFVDNINVKHGHSLTFRVRLEDRPDFGMTAGSDNGAPGRWLFHCHIGHHAGLGMISELVVLPRSPVDLWVVADQTGSFIDDFAQFKTDLKDVIERLVAALGTVRFGMARFQDFPIAPFGLPTDIPYERLVQLDQFTLPADLPALLTFVDTLPVPTPGSGGDGPESQLEAMMRSAVGPDPAIFNPNVNKLFLLWTDASFHLPTDGGGTYPGPAFIPTVDAILALDPPKVLGIASGGGGRPDLNSIARLTGALAVSPGVDCDADGKIDIRPGEPLVCDTPDTGQGVGEAIVRLVLGALGSGKPVANCRDVVTRPDDGMCTARVSVDDGSFDPDGDAITLAQVPDGPYLVGLNSVRLTVTDATELSDQCGALIQVLDVDVPTAQCNAPPKISPKFVPISFTATANDCDPGATAEITAFDCTGDCRVRIAGDTLHVDVAPAVGGQIFWNVLARDASGNSSETNCQVEVADLPDADGDGVPDDLDNCIEVDNPGQEDGNAGSDDDASLRGIQHYGDACDVDLDDDGTVGPSDFFGPFRPCLGAIALADPSCQIADLDGDGIVGPADFFGGLRPALGTRPGPGVTE